jgi:hypothetical protein
MALRVTEVDAAVLTLQRKRSGIVSRARELADERSAVTFGARCGYDPESYRRLGEINAMLAVLDAELRNTDAALTEAGKRLALAEKEIAT